MLLKTTHLIAAQLALSRAMAKLTVPKQLLETLHYVNGSFSSFGSHTAFRVYEPRSGKFVVCKRLSNVYVAILRQ